MAENKKSFILYSDLISVVKKLVERDRENKTNYAGELFLHILEYVNDKEPIAIDFIVEMAFEPIKQQLKRDLNEWTIIKEDRSNSGKIGNLKRWNLDLYDKVMAKEMTLKQAETIAKHRKASHPDSPISPPIANIADNVNDNVNVYLNIENFQKFRNSEFENLDQVLKNKLKSFGITKPIIRNTNNANRQYVDVVEILVYIFNSIDWSYTTMKNLDLNEERFRAFMRDFIKTYVSDSSLNYDESKFQGHFVNWVKKKI